MSEDGIPKLTDFGLAIMQEEILNFSTTFQGGGTMRWMVCAPPNNGWVTNRRLIELGSRAVLR